MKQKMLAVFLSVSLVFPASTGFAEAEEVVGDILKIAAAGIVMQKLEPLFGLGKKKTPEEKKAEEEAKALEKMQKKLNKAAKKVNASELEQMAESGNVQAQCILSYAYHTGQSVKHDEELAKLWQDRAEEENAALVKNFIPPEYGKEKVRLARLFTIAGHRAHLGQYVKQDINEAVMWNEMGAREKDKMAIAYMGSAYYTGRGVKQDYAMAISLLEQAGDEPLALQLLADAWTKGKGVEKDIEKGKLYAEYLKLVTKPKVEAKKEKKLKKNEKKLEAGELDGIIR